MDELSLRGKKPVNRVANRVVLRCCPHRCTAQRQTALQFLAWRRGPEAESEPMRRRGLRD
jgi:hypothetical protein